MKNLKIISDSPSVLSPLSSPIDLASSFCLGEASFPGGSDGKASTRNAEDLGLIPRLERFPEEGNGNQLQYSCLENPLDVGAW